jgi:hypothetical protein
MSKRDEWEADLTDWLIERPVKLHGVFVFLFLSMDGTIVTCLAIAMSLQSWLNAMDLAFLMTGGNGVVVFV